jgi:hypothetical protein
MSPEDARLEALRLAHSIGGTTKETLDRAEAYREFLAGPEVTIKEVVREVYVDEQGNPKIPNQREKP